MRKSIVGLIALFITGCACLSEEPAQDTALAVERVDSYKVRIGTVVVEPEASAIRVRGAVVLKPEHSRLRRGAVRVEAINAEGRVVSSEIAALRRLSVRQRSARFAATLDIEPIRVTRLRVIHVPGG